MSQPGPTPAGPDVWVLRHGATEWAVAGRHTGRTDLPLTTEGEAQAVELGRLLDGQAFDLVLVSPLARAQETCRLAGYADLAETCDDLLEWDYGDYEGLTSVQIRQQVPDWTIWTGVCPGGETIESVAARADRVVARILGGGYGQVALFAHGHILRVLTARWCRLDPVEGRRFSLDTATRSTLGWEHEYATVLRWNSR